MHSPKFWLIRPGTVMQLYKPKLGQVAVILCTTILNLKIVSQLLYTFYSFHLQVRIIYKTIC